jgi:hypothetical protein
MVVETDDDWSLLAIPRGLIAWFKQWQLDRMFGMTRFGRRPQTTRRGAYGAGAARGSDSAGS